MSFGENLRRLRREKNLTQAELADMTGIKHGHISTMETSDSADPKLSTVYKLLNALECSPNSLLQDQATIGLSGLMATTLERAALLDDHSQAVLIDVIDHYCMAKSAQAMLNTEKGRILPKIVWSAGNFDPVLKKNTD
ncbi:helix-turn-helix domain-containing protein [Pseudohongiella spirulinae]|uniref:Transcriptional regulator, XRE family n=1 Tax=Pseudohongiella spirulinae TaxID=1249552 RepID=A0A0S2KDC6_9GAMM|nr:helix-turn-helix transcriptional regulator [Pseudohongiella spirulinae]ALO46181.1 hypothetical protein PS2015_1525 [Pseudohongiella spirulinae]ALO46184.1 Transcriptional regulator, XRE family [Pseudohongiella spirulinae]